MGCIFSCFSATPNPEDTFDFSSDESSGSPNFNFIDNLINKFEEPLSFQQRLANHPSASSTSIVESQNVASVEKLEAATVNDLTESLEDEDVCPTCLEEYTFENPKVIAACSHDFHLSCIYEWQERSTTCPVCCQVMVFHETA